MLARNVINLRHALGLTQADLAAEAGLHRSYVGQIEQGRRNVSIDNIDRLAQALGVVARDLFATADLHDRPVEPESRLPAR